MKKEIPILFSTPMVQAILEGRKTQTRRIVKPQPDASKCDHRAWPEKPLPNWSPIGLNNGVLYCGVCGNCSELGKDYSGLRCPYGKPGDLIWVRETWRKYYHVDGHGYTKHDNAIVEFAADNLPMVPEMDGDGFQMQNKDGSEKFISWKPSIHMPKAVARIWLEVVSVKVERLQDISPGDALEEGVEYWNVDGHAFSGGELVADWKNYTWTAKKENDPNYQDRNFPSFANSIDSYRTLWQSINGDESWDLNPWVWVIEFKRINK